MLLILLWSLSWRREQKISNLSLNNRARIENRNFTGLGLRQIVKAHYLLCVSSSGVADRHCKIRYSRYIRDALGTRSSHWRLPHDFIKNYAPNYNLVETCTLFHMGLSCDLNNSQVLRASVYPKNFIAEQQRYTNERVVHSSLNDSLPQGSFTKYIAD